MRKVFISLLVSLSIVFANTLTVQANTNKAIETRLEILAEKYGYQLVELPEGSTATKMQSLKEIEMYLKKLRNSTKKELVETKKLKRQNSNDGDYTVMSSIINDSYQWHWWNPFADFDGIEILSWSNVYSEYSYTWNNNQPMVVSYDKGSIKSWISGTQLSWWDQIGTVPTITTTHNYHDTYKIKVSGRYVLGVEIAGFTVGFSRSDTWNVALVLV